MKFYDFEDSDDDNGDSNGDTDDDKLMPEGFMVIPQDVMVLMMITMIMMTAMMKNLVKKFHKRVRDHYHYTNIGRLHTVSVI